MTAGCCEVVASHPELRQTDSAPVLRHPIFIDRTMFGSRKSSLNLWFLLQYQPNLPWTASKIERKIRCKAEWLGSSLFTSPSLPQKWSTKCALEPLTQRPGSKELVYTIETPIWTLKSPRETRCTELPTTSKFSKPRRMLERCIRHRCCCHHIFSYAHVQTQTNLWVSTNHVNVVCMC